ncbi:MAG TPA: hypothetical protein VM364_04935 [Vicinamibacterales bacterium]|nr:hypothetical protein [Vicinamibacterales bacterium]
MKIPNSITARTIAAVVGGLLAAGPLTSAHAAASDRKKPKISIRANPPAGFSPLRVVLTAELRGGDDDHPDYYCPTIEWVWGDDTRAESVTDCDPYEPGRSEIQRRYTQSRIFNTFGDFKVEIRLKQKGKVVGAASTLVRVQPGIRDGGS